MPYTDKHQGFIEPLLDLDLDDLSNNPEELELQVEEIKKALTVNPFEPQSDSKEQARSPEELKKLKSKFFTIQRCFHAPEENLTRLEHTAGPITVGEVQAEMLGYIQKCLKNAAAKAKITLPWSPTTLIASISNETYNKPFVTPAEKKTDVFNSLEIPSPSDRVYEINNIRQHDFTRHFLMTVSINLANNVRTNVTYDLGYTSIRNGSFHTDFIERAQKAAEVIAIKEVLDYLVAKKIIDDLEVDHIPKGTKKYLLHNIFFKKIINKEINVWDMFIDDPDEAERIMNAGGISFIESKQCDLEALRLATEPQLRVMGDPYFHAKLLQKSASTSAERTTQSLDVASVFELKDEECSNLIYPPIIYLLRKEKISVAEAKEMTKIGKELISQQFYIDQIERGTMTFKQLNSCTYLEADNLLTPGIQTLLSEKLIDIERAKHFNIFEKNLLAYKNLIKLIISKRITLEQALQVPYRSALLLNTNELIFNLVNQGVIPIGDVDKILTRTLRLRPLNMADQMAAPLTTDQKELFLKCVKEFIVLAEQGILFAADLNFLHANFPIIEKEISNLTTAESNINTFILLRSESIQTRCIKNLTSRFNHVLTHDPLMMHAEKMDTFANLNKACTLISINFVKLAFNELIGQMNATYSKFGSLKIEEIVKLANKFGFEKEQMWGIAHAIRAFAIYEGLPCLIEPGNTDSIPQILEDMHTVQTQSNLSSNEFIFHFMSYLRQLVQEDLNESETLHKSPVIGNIQQILKGLEADKLSTPMTLATKFQAFQNIFEAAREGLHSSLGENYLDAKENQKKRPREEKDTLPPAKRLRLGLFDYSETGQDDQNAFARKICRNLLRFEPLIAKLAPAPTQTMALA